MSCIETLVCPLCTPLYDALPVEISMFQPFLASALTAFCRPQSCGWQPLRDSLAQHTIGSPAVARGSAPIARPQALGDAAAQQPFVQGPAFVEAALAGLARSAPARQREVRFSKA